MNSRPSITFGIIVLNGEPFTRYNLRSLYPFAHQILVVEGASPHAACIAGPDGHSNDGTLEVLRRFKAEEDPENKLQIVTAEDCGHPNGFWPGEKDEQSQAYATRATGDWLWQVDIDEFYMPDDVHRIMGMMHQGPEMTAVSFENRAFWGSIDVLVDGLYLRTGASEFHRLFRFGPGYRYVTHRPPTVLDSQGRDLRSLGWVRGKALARSGVYLYHYAMLFPKQVREKCGYYAQVFANRDCGLPQWAEQVFERLENPFRVHHTSPRPSWLDRYRGKHPPEVKAMIGDIRAGRVKMELRPTGDIEALLASPWYALGRVVLKAYSRAPFADFLSWSVRKARKVVRIALKDLPVAVWRKAKSALPFRRCGCP